MKKEILSLKDLQEMGIKLAKLAANRHIQAKVVEAKKKSLQKCGQAVPGIIVNAEAAINQGYEVRDLETDELVTRENASEYVVIIDAQHRLFAHLALLEDNSSNYTGEFYFMFPLSGEQNIAELLSEINTCTKPWSGADYVTGAVMASKAELPLLDFIHSLTAKGYSLPSASLFATLGTKLTARDMTKIMKGDPNAKVGNTCNLEAGKKIHEAASSKLGDNLLKTRTIIEWIISKRGETSKESLEAVNDHMVEFFNQLSDEQVKELKGLKGTSGGETLETKLNNKLSALYTEFKANKTQSQAEAEENVTD